MQYRITLDKIGTEPEVWYWSVNRADGEGPYSGLIECGTGLNRDAVLSQIARAVGVDFVRGNRD